MIKVELTKQDIDNIKNWYDVKSGESSCETREIGTLLKFGIKDGVRHGRKFKHDCKDCVYIGAIEKKYNCFTEGHVRDTWFDRGTSEVDKTKWAQDHLKALYDAKEVVQVSEYEIEFINEGRKCSAEAKKVDKVVVEYEHHDIFYCMREGSLIIRYGNKGEEYYSGLPGELRQVLKSMKEKEPNFPLIKIYKRALEIFTETGIEGKE